MLFQGVCPCFVVMVFDYFLHDVQIFEKLGTVDESALKACMNGHAQSPSAGAS